VTREEKMDEKSGGERERKRERRRRKRKREGERYFYHERLS